MEVYIEKTGKTLKIEGKIRLSALLKKLKINSEDVICVGNGVVVLSMQDLGRVKQLKILSVVSGG